MVITLKPIRLCFSNRGMAQYNTWRIPRRSS